MPAIVDHDARRASLAKTAANLIATQGLDAATVRRLAKAAGYSTKVVSHYFADKRALLLATYRFAADHAAERAAGAQHGAGDARAHTLSLLPTSPEMLRDWKVWFAFWGTAIVDEDFAHEQQRGVLRGREGIEDALSRDPAFAHLSVAENAKASRELITLVIGVALQAAFDPDDWSAERQAQPILERMDALAAG